MDRMLTTKLMTIRLTSITYTSWISCIELKSQPGAMSVSYMYIYNTVTKLIMNYIYTTYCQYLQKLTIFLHYLYSKHFYKCPSLWWIGAIAISTKSWWRPMQTTLYLEWKHNGMPRVCVIRVTITVYRSLTIWLRIRFTVRLKIILLVFTTLFMPFIPSPVKYRGQNHANTMLSYYIQTKTWTHQIWRES